jgi:hypothetical protein
MNCCNRPNRCNQRFVSMSASMQPGTRVESGNLLILAGNLSKTGLFLSISGKNLRILRDNLLILGFIPSLTNNIQNTHRMVQEGKERLPGPSILCLSPLNEPPSLFYCPAPGLRGTCHKPNRPRRQRTPSSPVRLMPPASDQSPSTFLNCS